jgi:hypothetical protein
MTTSLRKTIDAQRRDDLERMLRFRGLAGSSAKTDVSGSGVSHKAGKEIHRPKPIVSEKAYPQKP